MLKLSGTFAMSTKIKFANLANIVTGKLCRCWVIFKSMIFNFKGENWLYFDKYIIYLW